MTGFNSFAKLQPLCHRLPCQLLIPGLPYDLALSILALLPRSIWPALRSVAREWRQAVDSCDLAASRRELDRGEGWVYLVGKSLGKQRLLALDIGESHWYTVSDLPHQTSVALPWGGTEDVPLNGFELTAVGEKLVLIGGYQMLPAGTPAGSSAEDIGIHMDVDGEMADRDMSEGLQRLNQPITEGSEAAVSQGPIMRAHWQGSTQQTQPMAAEHTVVPRGTWVFNTLRNSWHPGARMRAPSRTFFASGEIGGKVYVAGGVSASGEPLDTAEMYDPETDRWHLLEPMPKSPAFPRCTGRCAGAVTKSQLHVFSVCSARGGLLVHLGVYSPATGHWSCPYESPCPRPLSDPPSPGWHVGPGLGIQTAVINDRIFIMRGLLDDHQGWADRSLREYDMATNDWSITAVMPDGGDLGQSQAKNVIRQAFSLASSQGEVLLVGGVAWAKLFGGTDVQSVKMCRPAERPEAATWRAVGHYEEELFLGHVWKCASVWL